MSELNRHCPVCGACQGEPHWRKGDLNLVRCLECGMVFVSPVPEAFASGSFYDQRADSYYLSPEKMASDYAPVRFERELKLFREFCPRGSVLDVGCSTGGFLFQLRHFHTPAGSPYEVAGMDVAASALEHAARQGIETIRGTFLTHDFCGRQFDSITFWAVLEHLVEPGRFLQRAASLLRPGGTCFVLVPNLDSLAIRFLGPDYRYVTGEHVNYFDRRSLLRLASQAATLQPEALRFTHFNPAVIWQDWRRGGAAATDRERLRLLARTTALKQSPWMKPVKSLYGAAERVLGAMGLADNLVLVLRKQGLSDDVLPV